VIGGLASSLLLTLVLVPVVYVALARPRAERVDGGGPPREREHEPTLFDATAR